MDKLKAQYPSIYIPTTSSNDSENDGENVSSSDAKGSLAEHFDFGASTQTDNSRLITHLANAVATTREETSKLLQTIQPLSERMVFLKDECSEKKKVVII